MCALNSTLSVYCFPQIVHVDGLSGDISDDEECKDEDDESSDSKSGFVLFVSTIGSVFGVIFTTFQHPKFMIDFNLISDPRNQA